MRALLAAIILVLITPVVGAAATTDNQKLVKTHLMVVTAHPDDEGGVAAVMARLALDGGKQVALVCATRGEGGGNSTGKESGPSLGQVREVELRRCLAVLGVQRLIFLDANDFGYTESASATLARWGHEERLRRLVRLVRLMRPDVIVTMDPAPTGGQHGHHQVAGRLATEAYEAAADPERFPELLKQEGLPIWRVRKLYFSSGNQPTLTVPNDTVSPSRGKNYGEIAGEALRNHRSQGFDRYFGQRPSGPPRPSRFVRVKSRVPLAPNEERDLLDGVDSPAVAAVELWAKPEQFQVAAEQTFIINAGFRNEGSVPIRDARLRLILPGGEEAAAPGDEEPDMRDVAPGRGGAVQYDVSRSGQTAGRRETYWVEATWTGEEGEQRLRQPVEVEVAPAVSVTVRPSAAEAEYRRWAEGQGIERLIARLPAHAPVTIGTTSDVVVDVVNRGAGREEGEVRLEVPAGWRLEQSALTYRLAAGEQRALTFRVIIPPGTPQRDYEAAAIAGAARDRAVLEALPQLVVRRLRRPMPVDADPAKWSAAGITAAEIPATALAQGQVSGPTEASGRFYVGYDDRALQVLVDVTDDTVVANIAPDDIKAHWRSTSTEISIDPTPRSEHTLAAFKLGIFPADTAGQVRAARDADANPGPVEQVDPEVKLASRRTPTGYVVEARIPFASLSPKGSRAIRATPGTRLGFNVILFHAGKKEAAIGEDINKARLAWAFRGGIWGRPVSWGTAVLE